MARFVVIESKYFVISRVDVLIGQISCGTNGCPISNFQCIFILKAITISEDHSISEAS